MQGTTVQPLTAHDTHLIVSCNSVGLESGQGSAERFFRSWESTQAPAGSELVEWVAWGSKTGLVTCLHLGAHPGGWAHLSPQLSLGLDVSHGDPHIQGSALPVQAVVALNFEERITTYIQCDTVMNIFLFNPVKFRNCKYLAKPNTGIHWGSHATACWGDILPQSSPDTNIQECF